MGDKKLPCRHKDTDGCQNAAFRSVVIAYRRVLLGCVWKHFAEVPCKRSSHAVIGQRLLWNRMGNEGVSQMHVNARAHRYTQTHRHTDTQTHRQTQPHTQTHRHTDTHTDTDTHTLIHLLTHTPPLFLPRRRWLSGTTIQPCVRTCANGRTVTKRHRCRL